VILEVEVWKLCRQTPRVPTFLQQVKVTSTSLGLCWGDLTFGFGCSDWWRPCQGGRYCVGEALTCLVYKGLFVGMTRMAADACVCFFLLFFCFHPCERLSFFGRLPTEERASYGGAAGFDGAGCHPHPAWSGFIL